MSQVHLSLFHEWREGAVILAGQGIHAPSEARMVMWRGCPNADCEDIVGGSSEMNLLGRMKSHLDRCPHN